MKSSFILWWIYVHAAPLLWTETERGNSSLKNAVKGIYVQTNKSYRFDVEYINDDKDVTR